MSAALLDIEKLLAPVAGDTPAGPSLRHEETYDAIREAQREDDPALLKDIGREQFKHAQWGQVAQLCQEALPRSKDLQLAAWLTEALLEQHGLPGLAEGLRLLAALAERYWDTAWPVLEGGEVSRRVAVLEWLDRNAPPRLKRLPLSQPEGGGAACCYADWERILHREKHEARFRDEKPARAEPQVLDPQGFLGALLSTPAAFYLSLGRGLLEVNDAVQEVERVFAQHLDEERSVLGQLQHALKDLRKVLEPVRDRMEPPAPSAPSSPPDPSAPIPPAPPRSSIRSRAEAYQWLTEASDYLLRTEPHSPTPYLVKRAVQWGAMPLGQLLEELVPGTDDLKSIFALLAIRDAK